MTWELVVFILGIVWALVALIALGYWKEIRTGQALMKSIEATGGKELRSVN